MMAARQLDRQQTGSALRGLLYLVLLVAAAFAVVLYVAPQRLPAPVRALIFGQPLDPRDDPDSPQYAPPVYRWTDDQGVVHVSDQPPAGQAYETVRIPRNTNIVPSTAPKPD